MKGFSIKDLYESLEDTSNLLKSDFANEYHSNKMHGNSGMNDYEGRDEHDEREEDKSKDLSGSDERIAKIREIALQGLSDNAKNVDSEAYVFYKKIWLMCDKAVSEKESVGGNSSNI